MLNLEIKSKKRPKSEGNIIQPRQRHKTNVDINRADNTLLRPTTNRKETSKKTKRHGDRFQCLIRQNVWNKI